MPDFRTLSFRSGTRTPRVAAALLLGTILVGCTAPGGAGGSKYEPTYMRLTEERAFAESLRQRYLELATHAYDRGDLERSDFYSLRALMAVEGKLAQPVASDQIDLSWGTAEEAAAANARLNAALSAGVRIGAPDLAARTQAAYDCWLLESTEGGDAAIAQSCRYNAFEALARLEAASVGARLSHAGGHEHAAPQSYVIDSGTPSRTIHANGVTIEVIQQQGAYETHAVPATYAMVEQPAPAMIETVPVEYEFEAPSGFDAVPIAMVEAEPMLATEMSHYQEPLDHTIDLGPYEERAMALPPQPTPVGAPVNIVPEQMYSADTVPAIDLGPVDTVAIEDGERMAMLPRVDMSETAIQAGGAADALMAAQAMMDSDFAVYFGFDSDAITLEAEDVLVDTLERIKLTGASRVTLTGFTDSMGDARYNQLLAMRRAQSVRKYLQQALGDGVSFEILPIGEVQAVKTGGDGVMEALNRRVEVSIQ